MTDLEKLKTEELAQLNEEDEIFDLETLITDGTQVRCPVIVEVIKEDGTFVKGSAKIRPLTSAEFNNATRFSTGKRKLTTSYDLEVVKRGLLTNNGEKFPPQLIEKMPGGVISELAIKISEISGVKINKVENMKMAKDLMGF